MPKFAVYYVPQANDKFYHLGTQILGYDIRTCQSVEISVERKNLFVGFDEGWVKDARPYGFHLTIGDSIDFILGDIHSIEYEIEDILNCFDPKHPFILQHSNKNFVTFWGDRKEIIVLRYDPNAYLKMLHALIVARVNSLGVGSIYLQSYLKDHNQYVNRLHQAYRIKKFYSPYVLDDYTPHFTLLNPYTGQDHDGLARLFSEMFSEFSNITVKSICLLVQRHENENWEIYREFRRE